MFNFIITKAVISSDWFIGISPHLKLWDFPMNDLGTNVLSSDSQVSGILA